MREYKFSLDDEVMRDISEEMRLLNLNRHSLAANTSLAGVAMQEIDEISLNVSTANEGIDIAEAPNAYWSEQLGDRAMLSDQATQQTGEFFGMRSRNNDYFLRNVPAQLKNNSSISKVLLNDN